MHVVSDYDPHDFLQPQTQVAVDKNLLSLSRNL